MNINGLPDLVLIDIFYQLSPKQRIAIARVEDVINKLCE